MVEYLLINCHADPLKKDNNGQIPLDIAINKQHFKCEWCLRKFMFSKDMVGFVKNLGGIFSILRNSR